MPPCACMLEQANSAQAITAVCAVRCPREFCYGVCPISDLHSVDHRPAAGPGFAGRLRITPTRVIGDTTSGSMRLHHAECAVSGPDLVDMCTNACINGLPRSPLYRSPLALRLSAAHPRRLPKIHIQSGALRAYPSRSQQVPEIKEPTTNSSRRIDYATVWLVFIGISPTAGMNRPTGSSRNPTRRKGNRLAAGAAPAYSIVHFDRLRGAVTIEEMNRSPLGYSCVLTPS